MVYWISTGLVALYLLISASTYLFHETTISGVRELGFPDFFRVQLAIMKLIAIVILLVPSVSIQFKEWAYAGVGFFIVTAIVAHWVHKDPMSLHLINLFIFGLLVVSNYTLLR